MEIQKVLYFLQDSGAHLELEFEANLYGPYADSIRQVLMRLEGHYTVGFGDGSSAVTNAEPIELLDGAAAEADDVLASTDLISSQIDRVLDLVEGFESPYGMELLATVHWIATRESSALSDGTSMVDRVQSWSQRKADLFTPDHILAARTRLIDRGWIDEPAPEPV